MGAVRSAMAATGWIVRLVVPRMIGDQDVRSGRGSTAGITARSDRGIYPISKRTYQVAERVAHRVVPMVEVTMRWPRACMQAAP